jgi:acyl dehydratase
MGQDVQNMVKSGTDRSPGGREVVTLEQYRERIGGPAAPSDWVLVDQTMVDRFAELTGDDAFIHVDPERAAKTRFGGTIAHGLFLASLLPLLMRSATPLIRRTAMGANYGYERVRFPASLKVGSCARGWFTLADIEQRGVDFYMLHYDVWIEAEGLDKPVLTARWLIARWMNHDGE